jgi:peptidoglycan/xylan/chitin deacetylase (PgdA/CDA1 family)
MGIDRKLILAAGLGVAVGGLAVGALVWRLRHVEPKTYGLRDDILIRGNTELREVALTFDDGPRPEIVRGMLDTLGKYGARSTFFVVGSQVERSPEIVRRMLNEGHEVGNHSFSHPTLEGLGEREIRRELVACDKAVFKATGAHTNLFRPPGMRYDDTVVDAAQALGYVTVHWNVAAKDFTPIDSDLVESRILDKVKPGSVVLLHAHPSTAKALPRILETLKERGYRFVTVSQMLSRLPRPVYVKTNAYGAAARVAAKNMAVKPAPARGTRPKRVAAIKGPTASPVRRSVPSKTAPQGVDAPTWN